MTKKPFINSALSLVMTLFILLSSSLSAQAACLEGGSISYTALDPISKLEWVRMDRLVRLSYNELLNSPWFTIHGFDFATTEQVTELFTNCDVTANAGFKGEYYPGASIIRSKIGGRHTGYGFHGRSGLSFWNDGWIDVDHANKTRKIAEVGTCKS